MNTPLPETTTENTTESSAKHKRQPKKSAGSPHASHPAVQAYRDTFDSYPSKAQMKAIAETDPPLDKWIIACKAWRLRPYNPRNIDGILDWTNNPSLMERFSGNGTQNKATMRNRTEETNEQTEYTGGWKPGELARYRELRRNGKPGEAEDYYRSLNEQDRALRSV